MNTNTRNTLIITGLAIGSLAFFAYKKTKELFTFKDAIGVGLGKIRNIKFDWSSFTIKAELDIILKNVTDKPIGAGTNLLTLKRVEMHKDGKQIGNAIVNKSVVSIPANKSITLERIPIGVDLTNAGNVIVSAITENDFKTLFDFVIVIGHGNAEYPINYSYDITGKLGKTI